MIILKKPILNKLDQVNNTQRQITPNNSGKQIHGQFLLSVDFLPQRNIFTLLLGLLSHWVSFSAYHDSFHACQWAYRVKVLVVLWLPSVIHFLLKFVCLLEIQTQTDLKYCVGVRVTVLPYIADRSIAVIKSMACKYLLPNFYDLWVLHGFKRAVPHNVTI